MHRGRCRPGARLRSVRAVSRGLRVSRRVFLAWRECRSPRRAFLRGWLFGLGSFGVGMSWVSESFAFANVTGVLALVLTVALVAGLALYPACLGWLLARLAPSGSDAPRLLAAYPAAWTLWEWLRGWAFTGFPWLQVGYSQIDGPAAGLAARDRSARYRSPHGVRGGRNRLRAGTPRPAGIRRARRLGRDVGGGDGTRTHRLGPAGGCAGGGGDRSRKRRPGPEVASGDARRHPGAVRGAYPGAVRRRSGGVARDGVARIFRHLSGLRPRAPHRGDQARQCRRHRGPDAGRSGRSLPERGRDARFRAGVLLQAPSRSVRRVPAVPFVLRPVVDALGIRMANFSPGPRAQEPMRLGGHVLGVSICYEIAFAPVVRLDLPEAALLVTVSNDAWFGDSIGPHQHLEIARARAAETGRWLVRATNTGLSAVISSRGEIRGRLPQFEVAADHVRGGSHGRCDPIRAVRGRADSSRSRGVARRRCGSTPAGAASGRRRPDGWSETCIE